MASLWDRVYYVRPGTPTPFFEYTHVPTRDNGPVFWGAAIAYVVVIWLLQRVMSTRKPLDLRTPLILWNWLLSVSSLVGAVLSSAIDCMCSMRRRRIRPRSHWRFNRRQRSQSSIVTAS